MQYKAMKTLRETILELPREAEPQSKDSTHATQGNTKPPNFIRPPWLANEKDNGSRT